MRRPTLLLLATAALMLLPTPARADDTGSVASCTHRWTDTASPGIGTSPDTSRFTSDGEKWPLVCEGTVRGFPVTGPGTFGEYGVIEGACAAGAGEVNFSFTIPTTAGEQKFRLKFTFVYGPGGGASRTDEFPGAFVFYPTKGDCVHAPVTEFKVVRTAVLFS
jgi:hypothetical protein